MHSAIWASATASDTSAGRRSDSTRSSTGSTAIRRRTLIYPRKWYSSQYIHGIRGDYAVSQKLTAYAGVDNLTDSLPPLDLVGDIAGEPFDSVGRYFYLGLTFDL